MTTDTTYTYLPLSSNSLLKKIKEENIINEFKSTYDFYLSNKNYKAIGLLINETFCQLKEDKSLVFILRSTYDQKEFISNYKDVFNSINAHLLVKHKQTYKRKHELLRGMEV
jgi:hypothetical protein